MTPAEIALQRRLRDAAQRDSKVQLSYAEFCQEAGLDVNQEIPTGIAFFLSYLFQPFQLYKRLATRTGRSPAIDLSEYLYAEDVFFLNEILGVDLEECGKHARQVLGISFSLVLLSLGAAFIWTKLTLLFCGYMLLGFVTFLVAIQIGRVRGCLPFLALGLFAGLLTFGYTLAGFSKPSRAVFFGGLIVMGLFARLPVSRIIAVFATVAGAILTLSMAEVGDWRHLPFLGLLIGSLWHSADILAKDREPSHWRLILTPFVLSGLFFLLLTGLQQVQFPERAASFSNAALKGVGIMTFGFSLGYGRIIESLVIAVYQLILYVLERVFRVTTIQFSPIRYTDSHLANLFLVPHLVYAYKREPPIAKKILNFCLISPQSRFIRWWVLKRLRPDAFLSVNSRNRTEALQLAEMLTREGLSIWYYEGQLVLGETDWERDIKTAIKYAKTSLVLIGQEGLGDFQKQEVEACLRKNFAAPASRYSYLFARSSSSRAV